MNRKRLLVALTVVGVCALLVWLSGSGLRHQDFGGIYRTEMVESSADNSWQSRWEKAEALVRRTLNVRQRPAPPQRGMQVGPARLGWSLGGHIYMSNPDSNDPLWEFALSSRRHLSEVTPQDLHCEFYGMNDPRGTNVFGPAYTGAFTRPAWEGHALRVADGQVFFARLVTNRAIIYAVQLGHWSYTTNGNGAQIGRIRARYLVVTNPPPSKITGANSRPAVPSGSQGLRRRALGVERRGRPHGAAAVAQFCRWAG